MLGTFLNLLLITLCSGVKCINPHLSGHELHESPAKVRKQKEVMQRQTLQAQQADAMCS